MQVEKNISASNSLTLYVIKYDDGEELLNKISTD